MNDPTRRRLVAGVVLAMAASAIGEDPSCYDRWFACWDPLTDARSECWDACSERFRPAVDACDDAFDRCETMEAVSRFRHCVTGPTRRSWLICPPPSELSVADVLAIMGAVVDGRDAVVAGCIRTSELPGDCERMDRDEDQDVDLADIANLLAPDWPRILRMRGHGEPGEF